MQYKTLYDSKVKRRIQSSELLPKQSVGADNVVPAPRRGGIDHPRAFSSHSDRRMWVRMFLDRLWLSMRPQQKKYFFMYSNSGIPRDIPNEFSGCALKELGMVRFGKLVICLLSRSAVLMNWISMPRIVGCDHGNYPDFEAYCTEFI